MSYATSTTIEQPYEPLVAQVRAALAALQAEPSIGLLPCNVVVGALDETTTAVEAVDPQTTVSMTDNAQTQDVADHATQGLRAALNSLTTNPVH